MEMINQNNDAFSEALLFVEKELGSDSLHMFLDSIHFNAETNHITLFVKNAACESEMRRRLIPGITEILHKHGTEGCVTIISSDRSIPREEQELARQVNKILGDDFEYMGHVDTEDGSFVVLKTAFSQGGEKDGIMLMELDASNEPITQWSFSILEEDMIVKVFRVFCEKYGAKADDR